MTFLVIGLGSMGKRRVRNLRALGHADLAGFERGLPCFIEASVEETEKIKALSTAVEGTCIVMATA